MRTTRVLWVGVIGLICGWGVVGQAPELERMDIVLKAVPNGPVARVNGAMIDAEEFKDLYIGELNRLALTLLRDSLSTILNH